MKDQKIVVELNISELATVLDALCMFQKTYEGKDADYKRVAYMEHFGCDSGIPLLSTEEISALYERIKFSPRNAAVPEPSAGQDG